MKNHEWNSSTLIYSVFGHQWPVLTHPRLVSHLGSYLSHHQWLKLASRYDRCRVGCCCHVICLLNCVIVGHSAVDLPDIRIWYANIIASLIWKKDFFQKINISANASFGCVQLQLDGRLASHSNKVLSRRSIFRFKGETLGLFCGLCWVKNVLGNQVLCPSCPKWHHVSPSHTVITCVIHFLERLQSD